MRSAPGEPASARSPSASSAPTVAARSASLSPTMVASTARPGRGAHRVARGGQQCRGGRVVEDLRGPDRRRQRQAAAEHLAERHDVRHDAVVSNACSVPGRPRPILTSSQIIGTPCARHSSCSRARKPSGGTTSPPSDRIGSTIRQAMVPPLRCCSASSRQAATSASIPPSGPAERGWGTAGTPHRGRRHARVDVHAGDAHRDADAAVVAVLEGDDGAPPGGVPAGPQRDVVGVGSRVPQIHPSLAGAGDQRQQILGQARPNRGAPRTSPPEPGAVADRPADRFDDGRVAVPEPASPSTSPTGRAVRDRRGSTSVEP